MMNARWIRIAGVLALAFVAGCANQSDPTAQTTNQEPVGTEIAQQPLDPVDEPRPAAREALAGLEAAVSDMDLYMHDIEPTGAERRKPTLWVHAAEGQLKADNSWALADARAVIYREQEEDILLESRAGSFDESRKVAVLDGGVKVAAGDLQFSTDSVSYDNTHRVVQTHSPVELSDGNTRLTAEAATLEPDDGVIMLSNVSGTLSLDGELK